MIDSKTPSESSPAKDYFSIEHLKSGLRRRALQGASITVMAQACNYALSTAGAIIQARLLTPHDFGLVTMVLSLSLLLSNFGANGFIEAVIQQEKIDSQQISTLFWLNVAISLLLMALFMAAAPVIAWFYQEPLLQPMVWVMAVSIVLPSLSNQHQALLRRNMEFLRTSLIEISATVVSLLVSIALAMYGWGYWALVAKWLVTPLVIAVGAWLLCGWRPGLPAWGTGVRPMLRFACSTYGTFVANYCRRNLDKVLIGRFLGSQALGNYDRAYHLSNMLLYQVISPLHSVAIATFSRVAHDPVAYRRHYLHVLSLLAFVSMPLSAALTLIGQDLILLLLGPQWHGAGAIFLAFGLSIGIGVLYDTHAWLHLSLGTPERWLRWGVVGFLVSTVCLVIGLAFGSLGVAVAWSVSNYLLIVPGLVYASRPVQIDMTSLVAAILPYFLSAIMAGLLCWSFLYSSVLASPWFLPLPIVLRILSATSLCLSVYVLCVVTVFRKRQVVGQCLAMLRDIVP